ncbi:MAG: 3-oxoacyl-[acyl-carrier-protein] synthase III C-terminal domain-containing protein [Pseudomonadota bacterium]
MKTSVDDHTGLEIAGIATCDFQDMTWLDNETLFREILGREESAKLTDFIVRNIGAEIRYHARPGKNAIDLGREALKRLLDKHPEALEEADFIIFAGISSPRPVTTVSALLADEFGFRNAGCWDLKSGCSSGVLAMIQAHGHMAHGARGGIIVCAETLSRFTDPSALQMAATIGDGAAALWVRRSENWHLTGLVHGTDPRYSQAMAVRGTFPVDPDTYNPAEYVFSFAQKPEGIKALGERWLGSLKDLMEVTGLSGTDVTGYIAHQVDATKNARVPAAVNIDASCVAKSFSRYGNMGCPTIFVNYADWLDQRETPPGPGDTLILHAVGGGLSWAALSLNLT